MQNYWWIQFTSNTNRKQTHTHTPLSNFKDNKTACHYSRNQMFKGYVHFKYMTQKGDPETKQNILEMCHVSTALQFIQVEPWVGDDGKPSRIFIPSKKRLKQDCRSGFSLQENQRYERFKFKSQGHVVIPRHLSRLLCCNYVLKTKEWVFPVFF